VERNREVLMAIQLTSQQWADIEPLGATPVPVSDPSQTVNYVVVRADLYDRFRARCEDVPVSDQERQFHLQEFGRRAGWDDSAVDI
jgi:hypothetical protein